MSARETKLHIQVVKWWKTWEGRQVPEACLFHIPNGGKRDVRGASILKAMGVRPGLPDLWILIPKHGFAGLCLELKIPGGKRSSDQTGIHNMLRGLSNLCIFTTFSFEEATGAISSYLAGHDFLQYFLDRRDLLRESIQSSILCDFSTQARAMRAASPPGFVHRFEAGKPSPFIA